MKSIFSKAAMVAVIASILALNVQAGTVHVSSADTGKMDKMSKMSKMDKMKKKDKMSKDTTKMSKMKKKGKMGKDTTKM